MKNIFMYTAITLALVACGEDDIPKDRVMQISQSYSVNPGDRVIKGTPETLVKVIHNSGKKSSTVSLLRGEATIIRKK